MTKHILIIFALTLVFSLDKNIYGQRPVKVKLNDEFTSLNANFPKDFTDRTFIKGLAMYRNNIEELAGSLIIIEDNEKASVLGRYIKNNQPPIKNITLSDVLYSSKINTKSSLNGSYMIASASASANSIVELIITDINGVLIPEQSIPYLEICNASQNVDKETKRKIYYVRSVKLTAVHSKAYKEVNIEAGINGTVFSAGGKVYSNSDQFKTDYVVSVDLVSFTNLLVTQDCEKIITNNELALRQVAEKAKQDSEKAETERKIKESELNSARAEVNALKNKLNEITKMLNQPNSNVADYKTETDSLKNNLIVALQKVDLAKEEFHKADDKSKQVAEKADQQQIKTEDIDNLIQKGDISVITEVTKLSGEEIKKLGFEEVEH